MLHLPDHVEHKVPISANHSNLVKFDSENASGYQTSKEQLLQFERDAPSVVAARFCESVFSSNTWRRFNICVVPAERIGKATGPSNPLHILLTVDYNTILYQIPKRFPGTCSWILETGVFKCWARGHRPSILWLRGDPGVGKSVIAKYLVQEVFGVASPSSTAQIDAGNGLDAPIVLFFCCSYSDTRARSLRSLLSSLLHQLLYHRPSLWDGVRRRHETITPLMAESVGCLWTMLADFICDLPTVAMTDYHEGQVSTPPRANLYIVVDALDELQKTSWNQFCDRFSQLLDQTRHAFRLIVTSRPEPDIERHFAYTWCLDLKADCQNQTDVAKYLRAVVLTYGTENNFGDETSQTILSELLLKAQGMFLWAALAWAFFTEGCGIWTKSTIRQRLQDLQRLPPGMEGLYYRILASVDGKSHSELLQTFQWIIVSRRPLTIKEMTVALALREKPRKKCDVALRISIENFLKKTCAHLVKISQTGAITFVHQSFRDYLLQTLEINSSTGRMTNTFHVDKRAADLEVGLDCIAYVVLDDFANNSLQDARRHVFFEYAAENWMLHLEGRNDKIDEIWVFFSRLVDPKTKCLRWFDTSQTIINIWMHDLSGLFEPAVKLGLDLNVYDGRGDHFIHVVVPEIRKFPLQSVKYVTHLGLNINGRTRFGQTLLHRCVSGWQDEMDDLLRLSEDRLPLSPQNPARSANPDQYPSGCCSTETALCNLLLLPGVDANAMDAFGYTPLSFAIHQGLERPASIILACQQLDIAKDSAALHIAAQEGVLPVIERLLERGVNVAEKTKYGETALHLAASYGHLRSLQLLASRSRVHVLNAKDQNGWTIAHRGVTSGNDELVFWLIQEPNINFDLKDRHGRRATAFAAAYGSEAMLKAMLERRPDDVTHMDSFGNTLFHMASTGSSEQNFSLLYRLHEHGWVARPGLNRWGKTVADLAPTSGMMKYLHGLGFSHSEKYLRHRAEISNVNHQYEKVKKLQALVKLRAALAADDAAVALQTQPFTNRLSSEPPPVDDTLGRRFNTIYAIDQAPSNKRMLSPSTASTDANEEPPRKKL